MDDFYKWTQAQQTALAERDIHHIDFAALAEEVGDMGKSERREIASSLEVILEHMLEMRFFGNERDDRQWKVSIAHARNRIADVLEESPSLAGYPGEVFVKAYKRAREDVESLDGPVPAECPWRLEQVLGSLKES